MQSQWTPENVLAVVGALVTLIGVISTNIVLVWKAIHGQQAIAQTAIEQAANQVPLSTVQAMQNRQRKTDTPQPVQVVNPDSQPVPVENTNDLPGAKS